MKVLIFSDLHLHTWKYGSVTDESGFNSRLLSQVRVLEQIDRYASENSIDTILFGGDLFHTHSSVPTQALHAASTCFRKLATGRTLYALVGNHDMSTRSGKIHSLGWLADIATVIDEPGTFELADIPLHAAPYIEELEPLQAFLSKTPQDAFVFGHQGVAGVPMGSGFTLNEHLTPEMLANIPSRISCWGHYHAHKAISPTDWVIGAPMQLTWGDCGSKCGFLVWDSEDNSLEQVESIAPEFRILDAGGANLESGIPPTFPVENNFIRIVNYKGSRDEIRKVLKEQGAASVEFELSAQSVVDDVVGKISIADFALDPLIQRYELTLPEEMRKIGQRIREGIPYEAS